MSGIKQPVTQVRLTNVAVVRYKTKGHRYEIACYKNKVVSWRQGVEHDIDEVLQSRHIFANVSKGVLAADELLLADFGTREEQHIAKVILDKGEIQVSEKERAAALDNLFRDISVLVADMAVNPDTRRPYPVRLIEQGMRDAHYSIQQRKSAKSQALAVIKLLQQHMPLDRAHMRVAITCESGAGKEMKRRLQPLIERVEDEEWGSVEYRVKVLLSPGNYRQVEELIAQQAKGRAHCEILDLKVVDDAIGDEDDEDDEDEEGHSDDDDDHPQPLPIIHQPAPRPTSTAAITSQLAATQISQPHSQPQTAAQQQRSKKAMRKVLDEEEIRTVGERREWEEEQDEVEDSSEVRQRQQQAARKAKKERKNKSKTAKHDDDEVEEEEVGAGRANAKKDKDSEEAEDESQPATKTEKKAVAAMQAVDEEGEEEDGTSSKTKREKKSRRKKKVAVVGSVTSLQPQSDDD